VPTPVRPAADACRRRGIPARVNGNPVPMAFSLLLIFGVVLFLGLVFLGGLPWLIVVPIALLVALPMIAMWVIGALRKSDARFSTSPGPGGVPTTRQASYDPQVKP
jgi:hypothetical protein